MKSGNKTLVIGLHFSETSKKTMQDKVKKLIKKDVEDGNFQPPSYIWLSYEKMSSKTFGKRSVTI